MTPNLFIIGAPKCGTSALAHYLSEHPNVFLSNPKEPFFLCDDYPHLRKQHFLETVDDYLTLFSEARPETHEVVGEASTNYLRSRVAVEKALAMSPNAKFIVMLRNPVDVVHAFHMEQVFARNEDVRDFETAWRLQEQRAAGKQIPPACRAPEFLQYRDIAMFSDQIERFFALVPERQRIILLQEDMKADTKSVYDDVIAFLGLQSDDREAFEAVNSSHAHRYEWLADFVLSPPGWLQPTMWQVRGFLRRHSLSGVAALKRQLRIRSERTPLAAEFRQELAEEFAEDVTSLEGLLERDLSAWR